MASPPGLFYAYAKNDKDDWSGRYLITFVSRAVADEWWRAITLSIKRGYTRFSHVIRHSIQFYSFNNSISPIFETLTDSNVTEGSNLLSKVFFTLLEDRKGRVVCPVPVLNYTDHRSGDTFFVRSMLQSDIFWFYDQTAGVIKPSKNRRTKFTITVVDPEQRLGANPILIGTDRFTISAGQDDLYVAEGGIVGEEQYSRLPNKTTVPTAEFNFSDFDGGFEIKFPRHYSGDDLQDAVIFPSSGNRGERWELV